MSEPLTESSDIRWFPVIVDRMARPRNNKIPWKLAEVVYAGYSQRYGTDQSLERIAERGGFGILEIADHLEDTIADLETKNTRLQARVEELERWLSSIPSSSRQAITERDDHKALAERRGEALRRIAAAPSLAWQVGTIARAAIDLTPEEARLEKQKQLGHKGV
ncbi:hypothetical protein LCGC14_2493940 [marine sediment metagenome]|uniref:Uncharacterized protein n=1 Tax=marine sediment metagenome TaxID=412755 RepID=A0A0F9B3V8_9ZZZZ